MQAKDIKRQKLKTGNRRKNRAKRENAAARFARRDEGTFQFPALAIYFALCSDQ